MKRQKPQQLSPLTPAAALTCHAVLRAQLLEQVARLERACALRHTQWDSELVRDLLEVNELVVGLEVLAEQMLEQSAFQHPAFSVLLEVGRELGLGLSSLEALSGLASRFASLALVSRCREGGKYQTRRDYRDFLIDGVALTERIDADQIPVFDWCVPEAQWENLEQLAGRRPGELEGGRVPLCVCPECGDLGCGALSARVEVGEDAVIWSDIGNQTDNEPGFRPVDLGPFRFERAQYFAVLGALRTALGPHRGRTP